MGESKRTFLIAGSAPLPKGTSQYEVYKFFDVAFLVDDDGLITDASFVCIHPLAASFLRSLVVGYDLKRGVRHMIDTIDERCNLVSQNALRRAIEMAHVRFQELGTSKRRKQGGPRALAAGDADPVGEFTNV